MPGTSQDKQIVFYVKLFKGKDHIIAIPPVSLDGLIVLAGNPQETVGRSIFTK